MIKELHELAWYAQKSIWRDEDFLRYLCNNKKEIIAMYRGILALHYRTDEEAARGLGLSLTSYKKYGKCLLAHLYNMVFFYSDEKAKSDATVNNIFQGARDMARMRMLAWRSCRTASRSAALQLLRRGLQYEWPEFVVEASIFLKESVVRLGGGEKEFEKYAALYRQYRQYDDLEREIWEWYYLIKMASRRKSGEQQLGPERILQYLETVKPALEATPSYFFQLYYFVIWNHYYLMVCDYPGLIGNCETAINFFRQKTYPVINPLAIFYNTKVAAHIVMGNYQQGRADLNQSLNIIQEGTANWFGAREINIYLCLHEGSYPEAIDWYTQVHNHRRLGYMHPDRRELWQIIGAYCYLVKTFHGLSSDKPFPVFRSRRFLNDVPGFSQDKDRMNVPILIAFVLLQLVEGRYAEIPDSIQSLNKYRSRHLRKGSQTMRSGIFTRILGLIPRSGFDRVRFAQLASPFLEQLNAHPLQMVHQPYEQEVIPYEALTQMITAYLPERSRRLQIRSSK